MGDPRDDDRNFDEMDEFEIDTDADAEADGFETLDENGEPIPKHRDDEMEDDEGAALDKLDEDHNDQRPRASRLVIVTARDTRSQSR